MERVSLRVRGKVQGVFYRASTEDVARRLGLVGWVRNREDGSVEILAEGPRHALEMLVQWAHQGPPRARVDAVEESWGPAEGGFTRFGRGQEG